jgi:hypothetical protein
MKTGDREPIERGIESREEQKSGEFAEAGAQLYSKA